MPIKIPNNLPAAQVLDRENVFYMNADRAYGQDIRPLKLCILNLMPVKSVAETQFLRLLGNSPLQVEVDFVYTESYVPQHTSQEYLTEFYGTFAEVRNKKYDGFLMTGAPVEQIFKQFDERTESSSSSTGVSRIFLIVSSPSSPSSPPEISLSLKLTKIAK